MPHPNGRIKQSGDTHLPDIESDLEFERRKPGLLHAAEPQASSANDTSIVEVEDELDQPNAGDLALLGSRRLTRPFWTEAQVPLKAIALLALGAVVLASLLPRRR